MSVKLEGNGFTEVRGKESNNVVGGSQCEKGGEGSVWGRLQGDGIVKGERRKCRYVQRERMLVRF